MGDKVVLITTDSLGHGDWELGRELAGTFLGLLAEARDVPKAIFFMNRGVFLPAADPPSIAALRTLQERGVEILTCFSCVDFYNLRQDIQVGLVVGMADFLELAIDHQVLTMA